MKKLVPVAVALAGAALMADPAAAEGWRFSVTPYLWLPGYDGSIGARPGVPPIDIDSEFDSIFDQFEGAFMIKGEIGYDRFSVLGDVDYVAISGSKSISIGTIPASGDLKVDTLDGTLALAYRVIDLDRLHVDLVGGVRYSSADIDANASLGVFQVSGTQSESWWDPIVGARADYYITNRSSLGFYGDVGGFGVSSELVWQAYVGYGYQLTSAITLLAGYRHYAVDYATDNFQMDIAMSGPIFGARLDF